MWRYWVFMLVVLGSLLVYAYFSDPCIGLVRREFSEKHPGYEIVSTDAESGSSESVRGVVTYREPPSREAEKEVWWYRNAGDGWALFKIVEPGAGSDQESPATRPSSPLLDEASERNRL